MFRASTRSSRKPIRTSGANVAPSGSLAPIASPDLDGRGAWVVMPTYNEAENLPAIAAAVLNALPQATLLVVDDGSPGGTGQLADRPAANESRVVVRHRAAKQGPGGAYLAGFELAPRAGAQIVIQMNADWSHDPGLIAPIVRGDADLVIGSRYVRGGGVEERAFGRRVISRSGSMFARTLLRLEPHDLTGGSKASPTATLEKLPFEGVHAGGYVFQIEMTYRAKGMRARKHEVPITFRDRTAGTFQPCPGAHPGSIDRRAEAPAGVHSDPASQQTQSLTCRSSGQARVPQRGSQHGRGCPRRLDP